MKIFKSVVLFIPILSACMSRQEPLKNEIEDAVIPVDHDYEEISEFELTWDSLFDVENERYYVYFYSLTCSHCQEVKNYVIEKAIEREDIYFVKATSKDQLTNDSKKIIGAEKPEDFYILGYPTLALFSSKKCTKNLSGIAQIKSELK